jgi:hypothetical protein
MKRIMSLLLVISLIFSLTAISVHAETAEVELTGEILTTVIDVDIPTTASFTINPNIPEGTEGRYIMPILEVFNASTAPITLSIVGFDNKANSENQFTEVTRSDRNWAELGANESTSYIYLGITGDSDQWGFLNHTDFISTPSAAEVQSSEQKLCHVKSDTTVNLQLECQSGSSFPNAITSVYELVFVASLYEKECVIIDFDIEGSDYIWNPEPVTEEIIVIDEMTIDFTVITEEDNSFYQVNGYDYTGSQSSRLDTMYSESARYITIEYMYEEQMVTKTILLSQPQ